MNFSGTVLETTGETLFQRVSGTISITEQGWAGELTIESDEDACTFRAVLVTDEGQQGEIFARRLVIGSRTIQFEGAGPPPAVPADEPPLPGL
jgi:hypothetical protein